ncbi:MAG: CPBP family intramembrane metalloprotease [Lachnospiraceae bacterium]|nr:CPBP family intramembrane metalloprotease [Lachnospiraceae bacterium]
MKQKWKYFLFSIIPVAIEMVSVRLIGLVISSLRSRGVLPGTMDSTNLNIWIHVIVLGVLAILFGLIWFRRSVVFPPKNAETDSSLPKRTPRKIISIFVLAFSLIYLSDVVMIVLYRIMPNQFVSNNSNLNEALSGIVWLTMLYAVILGPVIEEIIFRGLVFGYARKVFPVWLALIFQAALFGIYHWNLTQGIYAFVIGLFLGYLCLKGPGIRYSIPCHMTINFTSNVLLTYINNGLGAISPLFYEVFLYVVAFGGTFLGVWLLYSATKVKKERSS